MSCENNGIYGLGVLVKIPGLKKVSELKKMIFLYLGGLLGAFLGGLREF